MATKRKLKMVVYVNEEEHKKIRLYSATLPYSVSLQSVLRETILSKVETELDKTQLDSKQASN